MALRFQLLGVGLDTTRSLDRAIMAPSLNTAKSTIRSVGKYLQLQLVCQPDASPAQVVNHIYDQCASTSEVQTCKTASINQSDMFSECKHVLCCIQTDLGCSATPVSVMICIQTVVGCNTECSWMPSLPVVDDSEQPKGEADTEGHGHGVLGVCGHALEDLPGTNDGLHNG